VSAGGVVSAGVSAGGVVSSVVVAGGVVVVSFAESAQPLMTIAETTSIGAKNFFIVLVSQKVT
jgi:hypothetical protein